MSQQGNIVSRLWIGENVSGGNDVLFIFIQTSGILRNKFNISCKRDKHKYKVAN